MSRLQVWRRSREATSIPWGYKSEIGGYADVLPAEMIGVWPVLAQAVRGIDGSLMGGTALTILIAEGLVLRIGGVGCLGRAKRS